MAALDALVGRGSAAESGAFTAALDSLTEQSLAAKLQGRRTDQVAGKLGLWHVGAVRFVEAVTNSSQPNAHQRWAAVKSSHPELITESYKFPGRGNRPVDVIDTTTALQVLMLLPGKTAARFRLKAAVLTARFLSGDVTLVAEVFEMNALQTYLREHDPTHPLVRIAQTAEAQGQVGHAGPSSELEVRKLHLEIRALEEAAVERERKRKQDEEEAEQRRRTHEEALQKIREERLQKRARHEEEMPGVSAQSAALVEEGLQRRRAAIATSLAQGLIDQAEHDRCMLAVRPKRTDGTTIFDFVTKTLRGDRRCVAAVEREMRRRVASGEHPKPACDRDWAQRVLWFAGPDGAAIREVYQQEVDRRNRADGEGQQRLAFGRAAGSPTEEA